MQGYNHHEGVHNLWQLSLSVCILDTLKQCAYNASYYKRILQMNVSVSETWTSYIISDVVWTRPYENLCCCVLSNFTSVWTNFNLHHYFGRHSFHGHKKLNVLLVMEVFISDQGRISIVWMYVRHWIECTQNQLIIFTAMVFLLYRCYRYTAYPATLCIGPGGTYAVTSGFLCHPVSWRKSKTDFQSQVINLLNFSFHQLSRRDLIAGMFVC